MTAMSINLFDFIPAGEHAGIAAGASAFQCDAALSAGIAALPAAGGRIDLGAGKFNFADTINLKKAVTLQGAGGGQAWNYATVLQFPANKDGIIVNRWNTWGRGLENPPTTGGDASIIRNLAIKGTRNSSTIGNGVWMRTHAVLQDVYVGGFAQNGVQVIANSAGDADTMGNANGWQLSRVRIDGCGADAFYARGTDVNAGSASGVDVADCGGFGFRDLGFLGSKYDSCQAASCSAGPYYADNPNARHVFIDCYAEGGTPPSQLASRTTVVVGGNLHLSGIVGDAMVIADGEITPFVVWHTATDGGKRLALIVNKDANSFLDFVAWPDDDGWSLAWWNHTGKTLQWRHGRLDARVPLQLTTKLSTQLLDEAGAQVGPGKLLMDGAWVNASGGRFRYVDFRLLSDRIASLEARLTALGG